LPVYFDAIAGDAQRSEGAGTLDYTTNNWSTPTGARNYVIARLAVPTFGGGATGVAGNINVTANHSFNHLNFIPPFSGTYTLTGAQISTTKNLVLESTATNATIKNVIAGDLGITKKGTGKITLVGANTQTGQIDVNEGKLTLGIDGTTGTLVSTETINVAAGGEFEVATTSAGTPIINYNNPLIGSGNFILTGDNTLANAQKFYYTRAADSSTNFTGTWKANGSMLYNISNITQIGAGSKLEVNTRGNFSIHNIAAFNNPITINDNEGWYYLVSAVNFNLGAIRLEGTTTLNGDITINDNTAPISGDTSGKNSVFGSYAASNITINSKISGTGGISISRFNGYNGGVSTGVSYTFAGNVSNDFTGDSYLNGVGYLYSNVYASRTGGAVTFPTNVHLGNNTNGGVHLAMGATNQFGPGAVMSFENSTANQWTIFILFGFDQTLAGITAGTLDSSMAAIIENKLTAVPAASATLTLNGTGNYVYRAYIRDQNDSLHATKVNIVKSGAGTQTFANSLINYTGTTAVNEGELKLIDTSAYASPTTVANGGTLSVNNRTNGFASRGIRMGNSVVVNAGGVLNIDNTTGGIAGGWVTMSAANALTGAAGSTVNVNSGVLSRDGTTAAVINSSSDFNVGANGILSARGGTIGVGGLNGSGDTCSCWSGANVSYITMGNGNRNGYYTGRFRGNGGATDGTIDGGVLTIRKLGTGLQVITGDSTCSGTTVTFANGGILQVGDNTATGKICSGNITNDGTLEIKRTGVYALGASIMSGAGSFILSGTATVSSNAANTMTGPIEIKSGTLQLGAAGKYGTSGNLTIRSGATVEVGTSNGLNNAFNSGKNWLIEGTMNVTSTDAHTIGNITLNGGVMTGNWATTGASATYGSYFLTTGRTISVTENSTIQNVYMKGANASSTTFNISPTKVLTVSAIIKNGSADAWVTALVKDGAGEMFMSGNNTYTGGTTLKAGTLKAGDANAFGTGAITCDAACIPINCTINKNGYAVANVINNPGLCTILN